MLLKNAWKGNGSNCTEKSITLDPSSFSLSPDPLLSRVRLRDAFQSGSSEREREKERKTTNDPRVSSSAINPNGPFSRPLVASLDYVVPYSKRTPSNTPPTPRTFLRVSANTGIYEIREGFNLGQFLGSVPARYKLHGRRFAIVRVFLFSFSLSLPSLSLLCRKDTRRTTTITTTTTTTTTCVVVENDPDPKRGRSRPVP